MNSPKTGFQIYPPWCRNPNDCLSQSYCITDPFAVVPDQTYATEKLTNSPFHSSVLTSTEREDPGKSSSSLPTRYGSAEPVSEVRKHPFPEFGWNYTIQELGLPCPTESTNKDLHMPTCINLHKAGLRHSHRLKEKDATISIKQKAHVIFGATVVKVVSLFTLF